MNKSYKSDFQKQPSQPKSKDAIVNKVEVQKGKIIGNPPTMKQMTYPEKVSEQRAENALRRHGQHTDLHEPKTRRK